MILLITGSSTEPALFHPSCRPTLRIGHFQHLYLTLSQNGPPNTYIWSCRNQSYNHIRKEHPALTSDHVGTPPTTLSERPSTHIHQPMSERLSTYTRPCEEPILHAERLCTYIWQPMSKRLSTYIRPCMEPILHAERALHLHLTTNVRRVCTHIWSCRNQSYSHIRMAQHSHLTWKEPILSPWENGSALTSDHGRNFNI